VSRESLFNPEDNQRLNVIGLTAGALAVNALSGGVSPQTALELANAAMNTPENSSNATDSELARLAQMAEAQGNQDLAAALIQAREVAKQAHDELDAKDGDFAQAA
jgi:hypothetical protein